MLRKHVDPLNLMLENLSEVPGLTFEVEARVTARDPAGEVVARRQWLSTADPKHERLLLAVVGGRPQTRKGCFFRAPLPLLDEQVEGKLRQNDVDWQFWLARREEFFAYLDRSRGADGHWYWTGANPVGRHREFRVETGDVVRRKSVVQLAYGFIYGPIPERFRMLRLCDDPMCDNPAHHRACLNMPASGKKWDLEHLVEKPTPPPDTASGSIATCVSEAHQAGCGTHHSIRVEPKVVKESMMLNVGDQKVIAQYRVPARHLTKGR